MTAAVNYVCTSLGMRRARTVVLLGKVENAVGEQTTRFEETAEIPENCASQNSKIHGPTVAQ